MRAPLAPRVPTTSWWSATWAAFVVACLWTALGAHASVADCGPARLAIQNVDRARGTTFIGVFLGETGEPLRTYHRWRVERTHDGGPLPERWRYFSSSCHPIDFTVGGRYLVSTSHVAGPDALTTLAYLLPGDGRAELVAFEAPARQYPAATRVDTLEEALAVILDAPPDTATSRIRSRAPMPSDILLVVAFILGGTVLVRRRPFSVRRA